MTGVTGVTKVTEVTGVTGVTRVTGVTGAIRVTRVYAGEWAVGYWIVGVTSIQKIYGLYSVEHHKVEKWSYNVGCGWVLWVWWVCVGDG